MSAVMHDSGIAEFAEDLAKQADEFARVVGDGNPVASPVERSPLRSGAGLTAVLKLPVEVKVVLGAMTMQVASLGRLAPGAILSLDRKVGEPVDLVVSGQVVARGEIVVTKEENARFAISILEVCDARSRDR